MPKRPRILITWGGPAGIGPEVSLRSLSCTELFSVCQPILLGDRSVLESVAERCDLELPGQFLTQSEFESVQENDPHLAASVKDRSKKREDDLTSTAVAACGQNTAAVADNSAAAIQLLLCLRP